MFRRLRQTLKFLPIKNVILILFIHIKQSQSAGSVEEHLHHHGSKLGIGEDNIEIDELLFHRLDDLLSDHPMGDNHVFGGPVLLSNIQDVDTALTAARTDVDRLTEIRDDVLKLRDSLILHRDVQLANIAEITDQANKWQERNKETVQAALDSNRDAREKTTTQGRELRVQLLNETQMALVSVIEQDKESREKLEEIRAETAMNQANATKDVENFRNETDFALRETEDKTLQYRAVMEDTERRVEEQNLEYNQTITDLEEHGRAVQFILHERSRSDGDSGIKLVRGLYKGPDNFYESSFIGASAFATHDQSNYARTMGMGELVVAMNGVEFRTRELDYKLQSKPPVGSGGHYSDVIDIPLPPVPPAVTGTLQEQIAEMREYFKAFADQNTTHRDYRPYFKPVLCYMEGAWMRADTPLADLSPSDRHKLGATTWDEMFDLARYAAYTGRPYAHHDDVAVLPRLLRKPGPDGSPRSAQWNYRVLCHPVDEDVPTRHFQQMDDLSYRVPRGKTKDDTAMSAGARFRLFDGDGWQTEGLLDRLMSAVPGFDNSASPLQGTSLDGTTLMQEDGTTPLDVGRYHRHYWLDKGGKREPKMARRGFNDASLWVARTTEPDVAAVDGPTSCYKKGSGRSVRTVCDSLPEARFSYAIPLEVVYLTPLLAWNPHGLNTSKTPDEVSDRRIGHVTNPDRAFDGASETEYWHLTPIEFYQNESATTSVPAARKPIGVLDPQGQVVKVTTSGTKAVCDDLPGVPPLRLRYPIAPVHGEGSAAWKELNALKKLVQVEVGYTPRRVALAMSQTMKDPPGEHTHEISLSYEEYVNMTTEGGLTRMNLTTSPAASHKHMIELIYKALKGFSYSKCDGKLNCWDGHPKLVKVVSDIEYIKEFQQADPDNPTDDALDDADEAAMVEPLNDPGVDMTEAAAAAAAAGAEMSEDAEQDEGMMPT